MKPVNNDKQLSEIVIKGFKSLAECTLKLGSLNLLIGSNGAGKSNFISLFRMVRKLLESRLQNYTGLQGGPDTLLHFGRKRSPRLDVELYFGENGYLFSLVPTTDNRLMFDKESFYWKTSGAKEIGTGSHFETQAGEGTGTGIDKFVLPTMRKWEVYHFHDTGESALVKQLHPLNDNLRLKPDAANLAAFLYMMREVSPKHFKRIERTVQLVAPYFREFCLRPSVHNKEMIELEWFDKGSETPFKAHLLSDGTLRFICLAAVLLQPPETQPETILVDEPELGLHPYAISVLASLMRSVSVKRQLIVSTQSVELLDEFDAEDVIVVDRKEDKSVLRRLDENELSEWLEEYSLGELWKKNVFGGRLSR
ncbi:MAG: AAA family ATPase [bacterium]|nr:AAA family ATPase [bacterium]